MKNLAEKPVRIVVFAKAPQAGKAKTRLIPALGAQGAAHLAQRMLTRTLRQALAADIGTVELCAEPKVGSEAWRGVTLPPEIMTSEQVTGDLGARLAAATAHAAAQGEAVLLIGTDCPELDAPKLRAAARSLATQDAVLYPTADGGYALLGLNRFHASLFRDVPWSTGAVARLTLERLQALAWSVHIAPALHDVDEPEDLIYWNDHGVLDEA